MSRGERMLMYSLNKQQQVHNRLKRQTLLRTSSWLTGHSREQGGPSHSTPKKAANMHINSFLNVSAVSSIPDLASEALNQKQTTIAVDNQPSAVVSSSSNNDAAQVNDTPSHTVQNEVNSELTFITHADGESGCDAVVSARPSAADEGEDTEVSTGTVRLPQATDGVIRNEQRKRQRLSTAQRAEVAIAKTRHRMQKYTVKTGCNSACKRKCSTVIAEDQRKKINAEFWNMSHLQRRTFILHNTKRQLTTRHTSGTDSRRKYTYHYFLNGTNGAEAVCKTFFMTTLGFKKGSDKALQNALKSCSLDSITPTADRRGKAPSKSAIDKGLIRAHVESFHPAVSHYRREHAPERRYLPSDVTIKTMHDDFIRKNKIKCSYDVYRTVVKEMKISFTKLGNEECEKCTEFQLHNPLHTQELLDENRESCDQCSNWNEHIKRAKQARDEYRKDTEVTDAKSVFSADLEKVIMLPRMEMFKSVLFTRRIIAFNESFVPTGKTQKLKPFAVIWHEATAGRKREDIVSTFYAFFLQHRDTDHIVIWLDNCAAQNKNWCLFTFLVWLVNSDIVNVRIIEFKYLEAGHTFMSADSFHSQVERSMKQCDKVYDFGDFEACVNNANSGKADVKSMLYSDFYDWRDESSTYKLTRMTPRPYVADMVWLKAERGQNSIEYKTSFDQQTVFKCNFLNARAAKQGVSKAVARSSARGIPQEKKDDILLKLTRLMPSNRMAFWKDLPVSAVSDLVTDGHE